MLDWWCRQRLSAIIVDLRAHHCAGPFLQPVPWEELGLEDYLDVVEIPMDLNTIKETLETDGYIDDDGLFIQPEWFWEDVERCWQNCLDYYEDEQNDVDAYKFALDMRDFSDELQEQFWIGLDEFDGRVGNLDPALHSLAVAAGAAATAADAAVTAGENVAGYIANLFWGDDADKAKRDQPGFRPRCGPNRQHLFDFYKDMLSRYCGPVDIDDLTEELHEIQEELIRSFSAKQADGYETSDAFFQDQLDDEAEAMRFPDSDAKRPLRELLPNECLATPTLSLSKSRASSRSSQRSSKSTFSIPGSMNPKGSTMSITISACGSNSGSVASSLNFLRSRSDATSLLPELLRSSSGNIQVPMATRPPTEEQLKTMMPKRTCASPSNLKKKPKQQLVRNQIKNRSIGSGRMRASGSAPQSTTASWNV